MVSLSINEFSTYCLAYGFEALNQKKDSLEDSFLDVLEKRRDEIKEENLSNLAWLSIRFQNWETFFKASSQKHPNGTDKGEETALKQPRFFLCKKKSPH